MDLIEYLGVPLLLTEICELLIAIIIGVRGSRQFVVIIIMNFITNPVVNALVYLVTKHQALNNMIMALYFFVLEILVVLTEWMILSRHAKKDKLPLPPLMVSISLNAASFVSGLLAALMGRVF